MKELELDLTQGPMTRPQDYIILHLRLHLHVHIMNVLHFFNPYNKRHYNMYCI